MNNTTLKADQQARIMQKKNKEIVNQKNERDCIKVTVETIVIIIS